MARTLEELEDWEDGLMLSGVEFDLRAKQVHVYTTHGRLRVTVEALDVQVKVSEEPGGQVKRRVGKLTRIESDQWLGQTRRSARSTHIPL
jgi:hypothetical protein